MDLEFDGARTAESTGAMEKRSLFTRETLFQYLSAGILLPDEVRRAEQMVRNPNKLMAERVMDSSSRPAAA